MTVGIYEIHSDINSSSYIGSSRNIEKRLSRHRTYLRGNYHSNLHLQRAWNKYGEDAFRFRILVMCSNSQDLLIVEQAFIDGNNPEYNIGPAVGGPPSEETLHKLRLASMGNQYALGCKHSDAVRAKNSESHKGEKNHFYGKKHTIESRRKIAAAARGRKCTEETRCKMSNSRKGKPSPLKGRTRPPFSDEHKRKISTALKGRTFSDEHRSRLSQAAKARTKGKLK